MVPPYDHCHQSAFSLKILHFNVKSHIILQKSEDNWHFDSLKNIWNVTLMFFVCLPWELQKNVIIFCNLCATIGYLGWHLLMSAMILSLFMRTCLTYKEKAGLWYTTLSYSRLCHMMWVWFLQVKKLDSLLDFYQSFLLLETLFQDW